MPADRPIGPSLSAFHRFCLDHPRIAIQSARQVEQHLPSLHALFGKIPTPFSLTPFLRPRRFFQNMSALCRQLSEILEEVGHRAIEDGALLRVYGFPDFFLDVLSVHPGYSHLAPILRLDGHFVNGIFRVVETNADGSAGMNDSNAIERAAAETEAYHFLTRRMKIESLEMVDPLARMLVKYARAFRRGSSAPPRIGILDIPGVLTASEFVAVQKQIEKLGAQALIVTPGDLTGGKNLRARGGRLDLIYRRLVTRDAFDQWRKLAPLLNAYRNKNIRMVGSFRSELLHNKAILALLHDPRVRGKLNRAARNLIDRHVPKAMPLTRNAAEAAVDSKNRWVIKPLDAYGSRGVAVGKMLSQGKWKAALEQALRAGRYLLQEYVRAPRESVLRIVNGRPKLSRDMTSVGFFVYDGKMAGPYVRSGPRHPLSISYGAVTRPGFLVRS